MLLHSRCRSFAQKEKISVMILARVVPESLQSGTNDLVQHVAKNFRFGFLLWLINELPEISEVAPGLPAERFFR